MKNLILKKHLSESNAFYIVKMVAIFISFSMLATMGTVLAVEKEANSFQQAETSKNQMESRLLQPHLLTLASNKLDNHPLHYFKWYFFTSPEPSPWL